MGKKVFLLCMLLSGILAGCAARTDNPAGVRDSTDDTAVGQTEEVAAVVDRTLLDVDLGKMNDIQLIGNICYYVKYDKISDAERIALYLCRQEGEEPEEILYTYAEEGADYYLMCSRVDALGNWYNLYRRDTQEGTEVFLEKLDSRGESQYCLQADQFADVLLQEHIMDGVVGSQGEFYAVTFKGTILQWDEQGKELLKLESDVEEADMVKTAGFVNAGEAGVYLYHGITGSSITFRKVDSGQKTLGQKAAVELQSVFDGEEQIKVCGTYRDYCYLLTESGLWRYSLQGGQPEYMFSWSDPYINLERRQIEQISEDGDGLIILSCDDGLGSSARLKVDWKKQEELAEKTVITLGCDTYAAADLKNVASRYNAQSNQYLVEIKTYDLMDSGGKLDDMTLALLQGKGPDIFDFSFSLSISMEYYASKGILEDLTPYLADSGIRLVEPVTDALSVDGKLYTLGESFFLKGLVCPQEYSRDGGVSIQQCRDMVEAYPEAFFKKKAGHALVLDLLLDADMASYIDLQEGTCRFDSGEFTALLDMVVGWKEPADDGGISLFATPDELSGKKYLVEEVSFMSMVDYLAVRNAVKDFGAVTGYPNSRGEAMYQLFFQNLYGMNSASQNKEAAWDFLEYLISEENQKRISNYFPITEAGFEAALQRGQGENEGSINMFTMQMKTGLTPTEQDIKDMWEMVRHVYYPDREQSVISTIIQEETMLVFDGSKTAQQAAETIQNRVSLFLAE
ncbi:MAG: extracellular solute-binding protein [Butyrivibrio sp.]|nr:extracellular solute-binding protein [Acetatifactor muris]MCM1560381.1 extracellular solute-binding protein [Butyrivibrio sp.]